MTCYFVVGIVFLQLGLWWALFASRMVVAILARQDIDQESQQLAYPGAGLLRWPR